jgi:hypothetical protein
MRWVLPSAADGERVEPIPVPYQWAAGCPCSLPWAPPWLGQWIATAPATGKPGGSGSSGLGGDHVDAAKIIASGAEAGTRNDTLHKLACSRFRRHGTDPAGAAAVLDEVRTAWQAGDTSGLPWAEVLTLLASARKFIDRQQAAERAALAQWRAYIAGGRRD